MILENKNIIAATLAALILCFQSPAIAQDLNSGDAASTPPTAPAIPMLSGGVGDEELAHMQSVEKQYNVKLLFTDTTGIFVSSVPLRIEDKKGDIVVDTVTKGPVFLITLPAGSYKAVAQLGTESKETKIIAQNKGLRTYQVHFSQQAADTTGEVDSNPKSQ